MSVAVDFPQLLRYKVRESNLRTTDHVPEFFRLNNVLDAEKFYHLLQFNSDVKVYDELNSQLKELLKLRNVGRQFTEQELQQLIIEHLKNIPLDKYGVWVFYPWSNKVVHLLDEEEFVEVRTSRNKLKITDEEQEFLQQKKIGIIGLSVGQAIAVTLAMERTCGELRLADFDELELSNLNRVRTGVDQLGLSKVICAARQIAEIDPFIRIRCYTKGVSVDNLDDFIGAGAEQLDLLVEVCDSFDMKVLCRLAARQKNIPVIMETNDKGMLDIERFDIEDNRKILHGTVESLEGELKDVAVSLRKLSPQERMGYLTRVVGLENISDRMKLSLANMGKTLNSWPQLASSVVVGGGMVVNSCRRILLGSLKSSGRFFVDLDELVSDKPEKMAN